jgi:hypothetical protein
LWVLIAKETINIFREIAASDKFRALVRMRERARSSEASALLAARREAFLEGERKGAEERLMLIGQIAELQKQVDELKALAGKNKRNKPKKL